MGERLLEVLHGHALDESELRRYLEGGAGVAIDGRHMNDWIQGRAIPLSPGVRDARWKDFDRATMAKEALAYSRSPVALTPTRI